MSRDHHRLCFFESDVLRVQPTLHVLVSLGGAPTVLH